MSIQSRRVRYDLASGVLKPRLVDGQELPNWSEGPGIVDYVMRLMDDGWRLVHAVTPPRELLLERETR